MKTNVLETSCDAYHADLMKAFSLEIRIMDYAMGRKRFTCKMASAALGVDASTLSGVIKNRLLPDGKLSRELSKNKCPVTGNSAHWLYIPGGQLVLC
jgi:hypothetical protein